MTGRSVYSYRRLVEVDEPIVWRMLYEAARAAEEGRLSPNSIRNGQGVGTELLRLLFLAAREPFSGITLTVRAGSQAVRLYERFGFQRLPGELVNRVGGQSVRMYAAWK